MNFSYYPYGNANEHRKSDGTYKFSCQHGPNECKANIIMACAMNYHSNFTEYFPFVECMEKTNSPVNAGQKCANEFGWSDYSKIESCSQGKEGNMLEHEIAVATDSLVPQHQWTPWVVINGKPLSDHQLDVSLIKLVCNAYTGSDKPPACNNEVPMSHKVCMRE